MAAEIPCKLPAKDLASRIDWIRTEILPLALRRVPDPEDVVFEFPADPPTEKLLSDFVAFERECCDGLGWGLAPVSGDVLRLEIRGLPRDAAVLEGFELPSETPS